MKRILLFLLTIIFIYEVSGQYTNIVIDNSGTPNEPSIFMNPKNTDQIVAGANLNNFYYSSDGGYNWSSGILTSTNGVWGDPCIMADTSGNFYFFHLSNPDEGNWIDRIVCQKSTDGGQTWNNGSYAGLNGTKLQDKEWVTIDRRNNNIYMTWTQFDEYGSSAPEDSSLILFSRSEDAGETWSQPFRISQTGGNCIDNDYTVEGAVPAVGTNGEIYVAWAGRKTNGDLSIMFDKSLDGGETWLDEDIFVTDFPGGWTYNISGIYRCNGLPVTACDTSGGDYNGTIYVNWTDQRNGVDDTDVWLVKSTDGGNTWDSPVRINDDEPGNQQFFTWMAIDQTNGKLYFVFYDRRNLSGDATDVYMAVSDDGGNTFENFKISETSFTPNAGVFFGDYTNITVYNGKIRPIWVRADGMERSILTAIIEDNSSIYSVKPDLFTVEESYPNPFENEAYFSFKLYEPSFVSLNVYDIYGNRIVNLIDNEYIKKGKYSRKFQADKYNVPAGIYYFLFSSENKNISRKIILSK